MLRVIMNVKIIIKINIIMPSSAVAATALSPDKTRVCRVHLGVFRTAEHISFAEFIVQRHGTSDSTVHASINMQSVSFCRRYRQLSANNYLPHTYSI